MRRILREFLGKKTRHALFVRLPGKPPELEIVEIDFVVDGRLFLQALPERLEGGGAARLPRRQALDQKDALGFLGMR